MILRRRKRRNLDDRDQQRIEKPAISGGFRKPLCELGYTAAILRVQLLPRQFETDAIRFAKNIGTDAA